MMSSAQVTRKTVTNQMRPISKLPFVILFKDLKCNDVIMNIDILKTNELMRLNET
jgi:hypothetical protein